MLQELFKLFPVDLRGNYGVSLAHVGNCKPRGVVFYFSGMKYCLLAGMATATCQLHLISCDWGLAGICFSKEQVIG